MASGNEVNLAQYRIEQARECLNMAERIEENQ